MAVALSEWVRLIETEYLGEFIAGGGSAVKLIVTPDVEGINVSLAHVAGIADTQGYLVAWVDAALTKVQMIDQLFYAVARQVDWEAGLCVWLREQFVQNGYHPPEENPFADMDALAASGNNDRAGLMAEVRRWIRQELITDYSLVKEFRVAMSLLAWRQINPQTVTPNDAELVRGWLRGERVALPALKQVQIFGRIDRNNARFLLASLTAFLPRLGYRGLVLLLDISPVVSDVAPATGALRYSRAAAQDCYEVLRQFIDATDEMRHLLLVAAAGPGLIDNASRGLDSYTALKLRTSDEVRDQNRANPLGTMVRLDTTL